MPTQFAPGDDPCLRLAEDPNPKSAGFFGQFGATMKKNIIQKRRDKFGCCLETVLPIIFVIGLIFIWMASAPNDNPGRELAEVSAFNGSYAGWNGSLYGTLQRAKDVACIEFRGASAGTPPPYGISGNCSAFFAQKRAAAVAAGESPSSVSEHCYGANTGLPVDLCTAVEPQQLIGAHLDVAQARTIPSLDEMILVKWFARAANPNPSAAQRYSNYNSLTTNGMLYFAPRSPQMDQFVDFLNRTSALFQHVYAGTFADGASLEEFTRNTDNEGKNWAAVELTEASAATLNYKIRVNRTTVQTDELIDTYYSGGLGESEETMWYLQNGFLTLQKALSEWYITEIRGRQLPPEPLVAFMPYSEWEEQTFLQIAGGLMPLMIVLSFLYPVSQLTKRIVLEKETKVREAMMIMGLGTSSFYLSWFVTYALQFLVTSTVATILMQVTFTPKSSGVIIFIMFYFFSLSSVALAALMASCFSKAKLAALLAPVVYFVLAMPMFAVDNVPVAVHGLLLLLSPSAFSTGLTLLFSYERSEGLGSAQLTSGEESINALAAIFMLIVDTFLYVLLTLYLDAVLPSDWGTKRHPLFCFIEPFRYFRGTTDEVPEDTRDPNGAFEETRSTNPISVRIQGLTKIFERDSREFRAVDGLHLDLHENEVNVLLGHNGAGKTTTMNMMTGMLDVSKGDCVVYGKSVRKEKADVHKLIGYCPQHNILWPELTCRQHLEFFGTLKGLSSEELHDAVEKMLRDVDLGDKMDYLSSALSGGQKRKLSVAIAFIGDSKLVFLDEPTAGMDVAARRHTWDVIKQNSKGRTVLLTTHYMDEADLLGHTISIMSKGKLKCSGSSVFLKSRLGVGYALNMSVDPSKDMTPVTRAIVSEVPAAQPLPSGTGELAFRLPMAATDRFPAILRTLETRGDELGVRSFGITVTTLEEVFLKIADDEESETALTHADNYKDSEMSAVVPVEKVSRDDLWAAQQKQRELDPKQLMMQQFRTNLVKRLHNAKRDRRTQVLQIVVPVICVLLSMLFTLLSFVSTKELQIDPKMYSRISIDALDFDMANCNGILSATQFPGELRVADRTPVAGANATAFDDWLLATHDAHPNRRYNSLYCNASAFSAILGRPASLLYANASTMHGAPDVVNQYYRNYMRTLDAAAGSTTLTHIGVAVHPFPLTDREDAVFSSIRTIMIGIIILIPFTFIPSTFVSWIVKEYETKAKHLQTASGLNFFVYWFSNLVFDFVSFSVTTVLVILVFLCFGRDEYVGNGENFGATIMLFLLYGLAGIGASYLASFAFSEHATAQNVVMLSNFICGFLLVLVIFILGQIDSTKTAADVLKYFFRIVPSYCLGEGIINLATAQLTDAFGHAQGRFDMDVTGWSMLYMGLEFPLFMALTLIIDHPARRMKQERLLHNPDAKPEPIADEDVDVARERKEVEEGAASRSEDLVTVRGLSKRYPNGKLAVRNLSFGVHKGEVFGFLGTNGAGKTTSISILCGEQMPTTGKCTVVGSDVVSDALEAQKNIGYCPQFDALLELLTVKEHLELYSGLRGLDADSTVTVVQGLMDVCGLKQYENVVSSALSGGNKRKLSVAISLIGGPRVVFLDEPSAGMDPMARRGMWEVIEHVSQQCAVVLTTHHLEEVEALANRVAIMVDGKMYCIGDKTHLKNKFGSGFEFMARLEDESFCPAFEQFVRETMPAAALDEKRGTKYTFALPPTTKLSDTFHLVENAKRSGQFGIGDYGISQTSLEQVFLRISEAAEAADRECPAEDLSEEQANPIPGEFPRSPNHVQPSQLRWAQ